MNWLAIVLIVLFVAFTWLMVFALCRAARLGDEMAARLDTERRAAQQREEEPAVSNIALSWAFKCHVGNASAKAVLVYLADRADDDGTAAYPKIATIVDSHRTVRTNRAHRVEDSPGARVHPPRRPTVRAPRQGRTEPSAPVLPDRVGPRGGIRPVDPRSGSGRRTRRNAIPQTMGKTVDPEAGTVFENGESKDVLPENVGTKPIPSTANLAGLEKGPEPALQIPQGQHCESCTPSTANAAPPALRISQSCIYKDKTLQVNPPSKPSFPSAPTGHLPASGATAAEKT